MAGKPSEKNKRILDRAMEHIKSVPYRVSLRWVFYRLLQDGLYDDKDGYKHFTGISRKHRREFKGEWKPDTLADDTRPVFYHGWGYDNKDSAIIGAIENLKTPLTHFTGQDYYIELWFEAKAMYQQFAYYSQGVTLRPFGGDYTLDPKWTVSLDMVEAINRFNLPIVILYFGDLDKKGLQIPYSADKDIRLWSGIDYEFKVCGLNQEQVDIFHLQDNPNKPGTYQWEALTDEQAREIIVGNIEQYIDTEKIKSKEEESKKIQEELIEKIKTALSIEDK